MAAIHQKRMQMQMEFAENAVQLPYIGDITLEEVQKHNKADDNWVILNGEVYNVTSYLSRHPGGSSYFLGPERDITAMVKAIHPRVDIKKIIGKLKIGKLVSGTSE